MFLSLLLLLLLDDTGEEQFSSSSSREWITSSAEFVAESEDPALDVTVTPPLGEDVILMATPPIVGEEEDDDLEEDSPPELRVTVVGMDAEWIALSGGVEESPSSYELLLEDAADDDDGECSTSSPHSHTM